MLQEVGGGGGGGGGCRVNKFIKFALGEGGHASASGVQGW